LLTTPASFGVDLMIDKFTANSKTAPPFGATVDGAEFEKFRVSLPRGL
jgi:hypothetical protein